MLTELEIMADMEATAHAVESGLLVPTVTVNNKLLDALERCLEADARWPEIITTVPAPKDPTNTEEVEALEWKREQITKEIARAGRADRCSQRSRSRFVSSAAMTPPRLCRNVFAELVVNPPCLRTHRSRYNPQQPQLRGTFHTEGAIIHL